MSVTAHILGGCPIGIDSAHGVIDSNHEVFGHAGLYVMDGSAIPANVGVNPQPHYHRPGRASRKFDSQ